MKEQLRVVSLVPSLTELLFDLEVNVVGRTKFCIHPQERIQDCSQIGGTKNASVEKILSLKPDLVVANKEENVKETIDQLADRVEVILTEINTIDESFSEIKRVGEAVERLESVEKIIDRLKIKFDSIRGKGRGNLVYLIWKEPMLAAGKLTYINSVVEWMGFENYSEGARYPEITWRMLKENPPHQLFLSSEPYPFTAKHLMEFQNELPNTCVQRVEGEWFSWYGTRLLKIQDYKLA